jgi:hypothetical protein
MSIWSPFSANILTDLSTNDKHVLIEFIHLIY